MSYWDRNDWTIMFGSCAMWFHGLLIGAMIATLTH